MNQLIAILLATKSFTSVIHEDLELTYRSFEGILETAARILLSNRIQVYKDNMFFTIVFLKDEIELETVKIKYDKKLDTLLKEMQMNKNEITLDQKDKFLELLLKHLVYRKGDSQ